MGGFWGLTGLKIKLKISMACRVSKLAELSADANSVSYIVFGGVIRS